MAISVSGDQWLVLNASPDIREQLASCKPLHPRGLRGTPIAGVVLTNGDIDHIAGLLTLREKTAFDVFATSDIHEILNENSVFNVLDPELVSKQTIELDRDFEKSGLTVTPFAVPGKIALFKEGETVDTNAMGEQTIGLDISAGGKRLLYVPGCAALPDWLVERIAQADMVLFDGTVWEDDDMRRTGTGVKTGSRMGHLAMTGPEGSLERLGGISGKKVFIHINNTNPVLQPAGPERAQIEALGWTLAQDGMEFEL